MFLLIRSTACRRVAELCWMILAIAVPCSVYADESLSAPDIVDYRYFVLDAWYGAIGLPDDCFKAAVDARGRFCTEFGKSKAHQGTYPNPPAQDPVWLEADLAGGVDRTHQRMHSPAPQSR